MNDEKFVTAIEKLLDEKKAEDLVVYGVNLNEGEPTEFLVLASASNSVHLQSLANHLKDAVLQDQETYGLGKADWRVNGLPESGWLIVDLGAVHVHLMLQAMRDYYQLDKLFESRGVVYH